MTDREQKLREALERLTAETDNPISREIGRAALAASEPGQADEYAAYANHCAIEKKMPLTFHSWKRESLAQPATAKDGQTRATGLAGIIAGLKEAEEADEPHEYISGNTLEEARKLTKPEIGK